MSNYRRACIPGGVYFFTVVTHDRRPWFAGAHNVALLREAFRLTCADCPFAVDAAVILPDHLHCIWRLPEGDSDFAGRWREIKKYVSRRIAACSNHRGELDVWQRRYWEHLIRGDEDWRRHMDYVHYNPVKHGLVRRAVDWPWSSLHRLVARGVYPADWGVHEPERIGGMDFE